MNAQTLLSIEGRSAYYEFADTFAAFKAQLVAFAEYLRSGVPPVPSAETVAPMRIIIAAAASRDSGGKRVDLEPGENDPTFGLLRRGDSVGKDGFFSKDDQRKRE